MSQSTDDTAWAGTLSGATVPVFQPDTSTEPHSKSLSGLCDASPDSRHWYDRSHVAPQSQERFECRFCPDFLWD
jgi:hypothetical protein